MALKTHVVRAGESLGTIAKQYYGAAHLWPSIYAFTNRLAAQRGSGFQNIVDPNHLKIGDRLALPLMPGPARAQMVADRRLRGAVPVVLKPATSSAQSLSAPPSFAIAQLPGVAPVAGNPADSVPLAPFYGWIFKLDDIGLYETTLNGMKLTVKFKGDLTIQPKLGTPLLKLSNRDGEIDLHREAETIAGKLLTDYQFAFDGKANRIKFSCKMTQAGHAGTPDVGFGVPMPPDIIQEFLKFKPFTGTLDGHSFLVSSFAVELTLSRDQQTSPPSQPAPSYAPAEQRRSVLDSINWGAIAMTATIGVLAVGVFFFGGFALAAAVVFVGVGLGVTMWNQAEAKQRSSALIGARGYSASPDAMSLPEIVVHFHSPQ